MSDNFVERVTRAAYERYLEGLIGCCEPPWDMLPQSHRDNLMGAQRAAIAAMREPTIDMRRAFKEATQAETITGGIVLKCGWIFGWQAAIDAALQEKPE